MTTNPSPEYGHALKKYNEASTTEEKIKAMEDVLSTMPQHKSAENLRANLRTRYKKLIESLDKQKKSGKSSKVGIKKSDMQAAIVGFPNSGKTSLFNSLTDLHAKVSENQFTTTEPELGMMKYENAQVQLIDLPAFPNHDLGVLNSADVIILVVENLQQIEQAEQYLKKATGKKVIVLNKSDTLDDSQKRKTFENLRTKKHNFVLFSSFTKENLQELKKKIFDLFPIIRIYLKEPKKPVTDKPMILKENSTVKDVAEKILKGFSQKIKRTKITGPSAKFSEQVVGLDHILKDKDIVEFQTS